MAKTKQLKPKTKEPSPITYTCNGPVVKGARVACGQDLTDSINNVPQDGQEHKVTCPKCGVVALVRRT